MDKKATNKINIKDYVLWNVMPLLGNFEGEQDFVAFYVEFPEVVGISHYEKLWNHLDKRELRDFGSTKYI